MTRRFWPITVAGAVAVYAAGSFSVLAVAEATNEKGGSLAIVFALLAYFLLYHAADTARTSVINGIYKLGWFGIRSAYIDHETTVSPAKNDEVEE